MKDVCVNSLSKVLREAAKREKTQTNIRNTKAKSDQNEAANEKKLFGWTYR